MGRWSLRRRGGQPTPGAGDLFIEWYGAAALISHPADPPYAYWQLLNPAAGPTGDPLILMSARAGWHPAAGTVLAQAVRAVADGAHPPGRGGAARATGGRVWLGAAGLGRTTGAGAAWLTALSAESGVDLVATDGPITFPADGGLYTGPATGASGWRLFDPTGAGRVVGYRYPVADWEPTLPQHAVRSGPPAVLGAGWRRYTTRLYRLADPEDWLGHDGAVAAEVVPAGILLRPAGVYTSDAIAVVAPRSSTVTLGTAGLPVSAALVAAVWRLVAGTSPDPPGAVRLRLAGDADRALRPRIASLAREAGWELAAGFTGPPPAARVPAAPTPTPAVPAAGPAAVRAPAAVAVPAARAALVAVPVPVPAAVPAPAAVGSAVAVSPVTVAPVATIAEPSADRVAPDPVPDQAPAAPVAPAPVVSVARAAPPPAVAVPVAAAPGPGPGPGPVALVRVEQRASTTDEQRRFVAALGAAFNDSLATVNAALSTWPALRDESPGAKADYAAVCVYLGSSAGGAVRLNAALRAGRRPEIDGHLPCLVSGMRRLPLHRRAVLCQARLVGPVERTYPVGAVLTEPGFRSGSAGLDLAVPDANVDLLIWSRTARQLSVLGPAGRLLDETAFLAGTRFRVLEVRRSEPGGGDGASLPGTAVLLREVLPDERPVPDGLDAADQAVLDRLARALARRQSQPPRAVEDADLVGRLAGPALGVAGVPAAVYP